MQVYIYMQYNKESDFQTEFRVMLVTMTKDKKGQNMMKEIRQKCQLKVNIKLQWTANSTMSALPSHVVEGITIKFLFIKSTRL